VVDVIARLSARQQVLAPVFEPPHRALEPSRQLGDDDVFGIEVHLRPEPTSDGWTQDTDARLRDAEGLGQAAAHEVR